MEWNRIKIHRTSSKTGSIESRNLKPLVKGKGQKHQEAHWALEEEPFWRSTAVEHGVRVDP